jgi:hypothetical protein
MPLKDWERDVINRQRNIVFPDTVLNEGRFYRNLASGKAVFTLGQRISLLGIVGYVIFINALNFAGSFGEFLANQTNFPGWTLWPLTLSLIWLLFWIFLAMKALFSDRRPRKRRRGYHRSSIQ